jgi:hypothetical protein
LALRSANFKTLHIGIFIAFLVPAKKKIVHLLAAEQDYNNAKKYRQFYLKTVNILVENSTYFGR